MDGHGWVPLERMSWAVWEGREREEGWCQGKVIHPRGDASALPGDTQPTRGKYLTAAPSSCISKGFPAISP